MVGNKESMTGEQLGRTDLWTIHQERNKDKQFDILDIKMPESGFGWWHLIAVTSHRQALLQSTKTSSLTKCLSQRLAKGWAPAGRPSAPRKLQQRLLIFILKVCSVFTHIHLLILGQSFPPTLSPQPACSNTSLLQKGLCTLSFASHDPEEQWSSWPSRLC